MRDELVPDDLLAGLRRLLSEAGFTESGIRTAAGDAQGLDLRGAREFHRRRLAGGGRLDTLVLLFARGLPASEAAAARALAPLGLGELADAGLLEAEGDRIRPLVRILPYDGLLIAFDPDVAGGERGDFVTGVNPSARTLAYLAVRRRVASTLDLGTGSGIQALLAARHSGSVAAVDLNPRALAYLRLNLRLNGVQNVEPLEGSWFEPVRGRRFELVVANPPYVISPDAEHLFKDSGLTGDAASRLVVEQLPAHLEEGGVGQVICNWAHGADEDWRAPVEAWVAGRGVDALLLRYETVEPLEYAATWNRTLAHAPAELGAALDRWVEYDTRLGIERISWGMLVLRRRSARRNRVRAIEVPGWPRPRAGAQLERMLGAWDAPLDGEELEAAVLRPVEGVELLRRRVAGAEGWAPGRAHAALSGTVGFDLPLDDGSAAVVGDLDGRTTIGEAVARMHPDGDRARALTALRRLYELGFLVVEAP